MRCDKSQVFDGMPPCFRDATECVTVEVTRGKSADAVTEVSVCDPCAGLLRRTIGLRVASSTKIDWYASLAASGDAISGEYPEVSGAGVPFPPEPEKETGK